MTGCLRGKQEVALVVRPPQQLASPLVAKGNLYRLHIVYFDSLYALYWLAFVLTLSQQLRTFESRDVVVAEVRLHVGL